VSARCAAFLASCCGVALALAPARALAQGASGEARDEDAVENLSEPGVTWIEEGGASDQPAARALEVAGARGDASGAPKYLLQKIVIRGNEKTMRRVVLRYVGLTPGEVFSADDPRLEAARYRLLASGYFSHVNLSLKRGDREGWAALVIRVKERNTIVVKDLMIGVSEIKPYAYGSIGVAENSFLGTGIQIAGSFVGARDQVGYTLSIADDHFLDSDVGLHIEGRYAGAVDYFGHDDIFVGSSDEEVLYAKLKYKRAGVRLGIGYTLLLDYFFWVDYRFEFIRADVPASGSNTSYGETRPIEYGHLMPGNSTLSSIPFGVSRDTRDHPLLPSMGSFTEIGVELSSDVIGSDYEFSKLTITHDTYFPLGKGHSLKLGVFVGFIMGEAPFYCQFFVGDFSSFIPSRLLELNFSHLQPRLLDTSVQEMRYEDLAGSLDLEYSIPFYRGDGVVYGVNGFVDLGVFALASRPDLRTDPQGYQGYEVVPMDLTSDLGVRIDTRFGVFTVSVANLFAVIPGIRQVMAER
jgi:outer membrane protein insertion porin family